MGGNKKQAQRSKGNLHASSSARAAQLLQSKNAHISAPLGFKKESPGADNVDSTITAAIRKLGKKETVTKQKALVEIADSLNEDNVEGVLPLWVRHYPKISIDSDRKVRELSQQVQVKVSSLAGRNLAPHITGFIGPWLEGTCDVHATAAEVATNSLHSTFPGDKLANALTFCEKGLVKHLSERLASSPSSLSDLKITDPVDAEEKWERVVGSALSATITALTITDQLPSLRALLTDGPVWTLARSKSPKVRRHIYRFIGELAGLGNVPVPGLKALGQQLNSCSHQTTETHLSALTSLLTSHKEEFWGAVSLPDIRGQLLDALRSKALAAGVLETLYCHFETLSPLIQEQLTKVGDPGDWLGDVTTAALKCLGQCKNQGDRATIVCLLASISAQLSEPQVKQLVSAVTICPIPETLVPSLRSLLSSTAQPLAAVAPNEHHTPNTISLALLLPPHHLTYLAEQCTARLHEYAFLSSLLSALPDLGPVLWSRLRGDTPSDEVAITNLTNSHFLPQLSAATSPEDTAAVCRLFVVILGVAGGAGEGLAATLVSMSQHTLAAGGVFVRAELDRGRKLLPLEVLLRLSDEGTDRELARDLVKLGRPELTRELVKRVRARVLEGRSAEVAHLMEWVPWVEVGADTAHVLLTSLSSAEQLSAMTSTLVRVVTDLPELANPLLSRLCELETADSGVMVAVFGDRPAVVMDYFSRSLPSLSAPVAMLVELYDSHGILLSAPLPSSPGDVWEERHGTMLVLWLAFTRECLPAVCAVSRTGLAELVYLEYVTQRTTETLSLLGEEMWTVVESASSTHLPILLLALAESGTTLDPTLLSTLPNIDTDPCGGLGCSSPAELPARVTSLLEEEGTLTLEMAARVARGLRAALPSITTLEAFTPVLCATVTLAEFLTSSGERAKEDYTLLVCFSALAALYSSLEDRISALSAEYADLAEDWKVFFKPGIQEFVLELHAQNPLSRHLATVALYAPEKAVGEFVERKLGSKPTFQRCFEYLMMEQYSSEAPFESRQVSFYQTVHCHSLYDTVSDSQNEEEFQSPPRVFLDQLEGLDLEGCCCERDLEVVLTKATQIWLLLLLHERSCSRDTAREHVEYLRSKGTLGDFLDSLVCLIDFEGRNQKIPNLASLTSPDAAKGDSVARLAGQCLAGIAEVFPVLLRSWWKRQGKEVSQSVDRFVTKFISPGLIRQETNLQIGADETLKVKSRPAVREVLACYEMDDITADLLVVIAPNHPLVAPSVSCERQVGVPMGTWRSWMLQITALFQNQNSRIYDALVHWKGNMDRQFEGIESCMICFSVVQGPKKMLPKPTCRTCKKKFHSSCLYKWFSTSGKSTCPLCRATFQHSSGLRARLNERQDEDED